MQTYFRRTGTFINCKEKQLMFLIFSVPHSCSTVLPHLPPSCANRRQTYPGTVHLRSFACAPSSRVSVSHSSTKPQTSILLIITQENTFDSAVWSATSGDTNRASNFLPPVGVEHPPHGCRGASLCLFRIKGHGPVRAQHDPHVRDTQMNMCQRQGNESRAREAWERAILIRAVIKPCQEKEAMPLLTSTHL